MNTNRYQMREARARLTEIVERVLNGEVIILTKMNKPIVKIERIEGSE